MTASLIFLLIKTAGGLSVGHFFKFNRALIRNGNDKQIIIFSGRLTWTAQPTINFF